VSAGGAPPVGQPGWACEHARQPCTPPGGSWGGLSLLLAKNTQAETAGLKRQLDSFERNAAARDAALASVQRAMDDGGARRDAESRGRADHHEKSAELAYKRAQGLADDLMRTNHALETLRRDGDAKAAGMDMAIKRLEAQVIMMR